MGLRMWAKTLILAGIVVCLVGMGPETSAAGVAQDHESLPFLGSGRGHWDTSVGVFFWRDEFHLRNLQVRGDIDLAPGLRWHGVVRSNRELDDLKKWAPNFDEHYIEAFGFQEGSAGVLSASLRVGTVRYLHFPYPDAIAVFDQVPGVSDLNNGAKTGYSGGVLTLDYSGKAGWGLHASGIRWGFGRDGGTQLMEGYAFYRRDFGKVHFETHLGELAVRPEPLGRREQGVNVFMGFPCKGYTVGFLYEKLRNQPMYTGIQLTFPRNRTTEALGRVAFDYDRSPEGFAMQVPIAAGNIGGLRTQVPANGVLVGEVKAERIRTYWPGTQLLRTPPICLGGNGKERSSGCGEGGTLVFTE